MIFELLRADIKSDILHVVKPRKQKSGVSWSARTSVNVSKIFPEIIALNDGILPIRWTSDKENVYIELLRSFSITERFFDAAFLLRTR